MRSRRATVLCAVLLSTLMAAPAALAAQITGTLRHSAGDGLEGATVSFSSGVAPVETAADGTYRAAVPPLALQTPITVTPRLAGYTFEPASRQVVVSDGDVVANFTARGAAQPQAISCAVTTTSIAPATAVPGQVDVPLLRVSCAASGGSVKITGLTAIDGGTIAGSKVSLKVVGAAGTLTGTPAYNTSTKTWTVTFPSPVTIASGSSTVFYLLQSYGTGTAGQTAKLYLQKLAVPSGTMVTGNVPYMSGTVSIVAPPTLTVTSTNLAPATTNAGTADVPMLKLSCAATNGSVNISGLVIADLGTITADKVSLKVVGSGGTLSSSPTYNSSTKTWTVTLPKVITVPSGGSTMFYLFESVGPSTGGKTIQLSAKQVVATAPAVVSGTFPQNSSVTSINLPPVPTLTTTATSLAPSSATPGQVDVPMLRLSCAATNGTVKITGLVVQDLGSITADRVSLKVTGTAGTLTGSPAYNTATKTWTVTFPSAVSVAAGASTVFYLLESVGTGTTGKTIKLAANAVKVTSPAVSSGSFPLSSGLTTIGSAPAATLTVTATNLAAATATAGTVDVPMLKLSCAASGGSVTITGLVLQDTGSIASGKVTLKVQGSAGVITGTPAYNATTKTWTVTFPTAVTVASGAATMLYLFETPATGTAGSTLRLAANAVKVTAAAVTSGSFPFVSATTTVR
ncbi:MAG: hypothetical protein IT204_16285 [Fimbriimonadaceae bacterium]|nr:hypothetical protein [Fimbriimonadaceae bacterium]